MSSSGEEINLAGDLPNRAIDIAEQKPDVRQAFPTTQASSGDITADLANADDNDQLLVLDSGNYTISGSVSLGGSLTGLVGAGSDSTTIEISGTHEYLFGTVQCDTPVIEGVTFDMTGGGGCAFGRFKTSDQGWFEDVVVRGQRDRIGNGTGLFSWLIEAVNSNATNFIHRVHQPDGDAFHSGSSLTSHAIPFSSDPDHEGYNVWKECHVEGFSNNGYYTGHSSRGSTNCFWNSSAKDNRAGNFRLGEQDIVVGGKAELTSGAPGAGTGQGVAVDYPGDVRIIGLQIVGDTYGDLIQTRQEVQNVTFDRVLVHGTSSSGDIAQFGGGADVTLQGGWWLDEGGGGIDIGSASVSADSNWAYRGSINGSITIDGESVSSDSGLPDPQPFPSFHFDGVVSGGGTDYGGVGGWDSGGGGTGGFIDGSDSPGSRWGLVEEQTATISGGAFGEVSVTVEPQWFNSGSGTGGGGGDGGVGGWTGGGGPEFDGEVVSITDHGGVGDGSTDDTEALRAALDEVTGSDTHTTVSLPETDDAYIISDLISVPSGLEIVGDGSDQTTVRSQDGSNGTIFDMSTESALRDFHLDCNASGRGSGNNIGVRIRHVNNIGIESLDIRDISDGFEGVGIYLIANNDGAQDTYGVDIANTHIEGGYQNGDNSGDFLIRARTPFRGSHATEDLENSIRDVEIISCSFGGEGKSAVELVGPATVDNRVADSTAEEFVTCTGIFESSLGGKRNEFDGCSIINCSGDSTANGFYSDGFNESGTPERRAEDDTYTNCEVKGFDQIGSGSIRAFRARRADRIEFNECSAEDVSASGGDGVGWNIADSTDITLNSPRTRNVDISVQEFDNVSGLEINNEDFQ